MSEDGDESPANSSGAKRPRRPRNPVQGSVETEDVAELEPEIIAKKPRGRPKKDAGHVDVDFSSSPPKKRGRPKKIEKRDEDTGAEAELEDDATPVSQTVYDPPDRQVPRSVRSRGTVPSESPISAPSAPSSSRRRSVKPSSSTSASETQTPSDTGESRAKKQSVRLSEPSLDVMEEVKEESEKEDVATKKSSKVKTPRRSTGEDSGFSDFNPFQSGSEEAAERERRRRKVRAQRAGSANRS